MPREEEEGENKEKEEKENEERRLPLSSAVNVCKCIECTANTMRRKTRK